MTGTTDGVMWRTDDDGAGWSIMIEQDAARGVASPWAAIAASSSATTRRVTGLRAAAPGAIGLSAVAAFWWWRGRPGVALVTAGVAFALLQASVVWPAASRRAMRVVERVGLAVGAGLSVLVLGITWLVVIVPVALLNRLVRIDLLAHGRPSGWQPAAAIERAQRPYRQDPPMAGQAGRRIVRFSAVVLLLVALTVAVVDRAVTDAPPPLTPFGARATAAPAGEIFEDQWVTYRGVPVSRQLFPGEPWGAELLSVQEAPAPCDAVNVAAEYDNETFHLSTPHVNVEAGRRRSYAVARPEYTVWVFGGSTTYGIGQRDEHTIPSALVRIAAEQGVRLEVLNLGCPGKVNWAETVEFEAMLRAGMGPPDAAVFLDGINEWNAAFSREVFGLLDPGEPFVGYGSEAEQDALLAAARERAYVETHDQERQARLAAAQYGAGVRRGRALGEEFGVPVVHFWQPALFTMPLSAPGNLTVLHNDEVDPVSNLEAGRHYRRAAERSGVDPIDLMDIFDDATQPLYFDCCHTNEAGARLEAEAMYPFVAEALGR